jgi:hypothetical protein
VDAPQRHKNLKQVAANLRTRIERGQAFSCADIDESALARESEVDEDNVKRKVEIATTTPRRLNGDRRIHNENVIHLHVAVVKREFCLQNI